MRQAAIVQCAHVTCNISNKSNLQTGIQAISITSVSVLVTGLSETHPGGDGGRSSVLVDAGARFLRASSSLRSTWFSSSNACSLSSELVLWLVPTLVDCFVALVLAAETFVFPVFPVFDVPSMEDALPFPFLIATILGMWSRNTTVACPISTPNPRMKANKSRSPLIAYLYVCRD